MLHLLSATWFYMPHTLVGGFWTKRNQTAMLYLGQLRSMLQRRMRWSNVLHCKMPNCQTDQYTPISIYYCIYSDYSVLSQYSHNPIVQFFVDVTKPSMEACFRARDLQDSGASINFFKFQVAVLLESIRFTLFHQ